MRGGRERASLFSHPFPWPPPQLLQRWRRRRRWRQRWRRRWRWRRRQWRRNPPPWHCHHPPPTCLSSSLAFLQAAAHLPTTLLSTVGCCVGAPHLHQQPRQKQPVIVVLVVRMEIYQFCNKSTWWVRKPISK